MVETTVNEIDEDLYSRQLYVLGTEGMRRMAVTDVLISGLGGLGVEIAKNIILAGVRSVTLHDPTPIILRDLSAHFFASLENCRQNKAEVCKDKLAELNTHVSVHILSKPNLESEDLKKFSVVVVTQASHEQCAEIGRLCHEIGVKLVLAGTCGVFGRVFCDFGEDFTVVDPTGEDSPFVMVQQIEKSENGLVTCLEETRHDFETGDCVTFSEVRGMTQLNGCDPRKVTVVGPDAFTIGDTSGMSEYVSGGICSKVKMPKSMSFKSYIDAFKEPEVLISDFTKIDRSSQLHLCFAALSEYSKSHNGSFPRTWNQADALEFLKCIKTLNNSLKGTGAFVGELDDHLCCLFASTYYGQCCPIQAVIGGFAAQEVMKACTGKFSPLNQWFYFDATECLPLPSTNETNKTEGKVPLIEEADAGARGTRYDGQAAIFGYKLQEKLTKLKYFMVGAGAIGCELLKNLALMGVGASPNGKVTVTDMDSIERSNLNRQFLFRPWDISKMKSSVAAAAVKRMNPDMNIEAHENRVGSETENVYNDAFFEPLDGIVNALDNIEARIYMDRRCVYYRKPLLESGTLGTKANVQIVLPYLTESYTSSQDPPEKSFPACTLKNFPYLIQHTIQWSRDLFEGLFVQESQNMDSFLREPEQFLSRTMAGPGNQPLETLETLKSNLIEMRPTNFADCVTWARLLWQEHYTNAISQLLFVFPPNHLTTTGTPFWSGTKRCPESLTFNISNATHVDFVLAAANLRAYAFGIPQCRNVMKIIPMIQEVKVPPFKPRTGVKIAVTEGEAEARANAPVSDKKKLKELKDLLIKQSGLSELKINVIEFEKDDDTNFHMDFITAASNLRANCYGIQPADRLKSKQIAGKIIPAIATTTSIVAGLVCLELYKLAQGHNDVTLYKSAYIDLASPFFAFFEPGPPAISKYYDNEFSLWDRFEVKGPMTLRQFLDHFKKQYKLDVTMLSHDVSMLFTFFMPKDKQKERIEMSIPQLVTIVSKKTIPPHTKALVFDICCSDTEGNDVDVPYVRYVLDSDMK